MSVGTSSLKRAAESAAAAKTAKKTKTPRPTKPKTDKEAMPTEVMLSEMVPSSETSRPAEFPVTDLPLPGQTDPVVAPDPLTDPQAPATLPIREEVDPLSSYSIGDDLPVHLL